MSVTGMNPLQLANSKWLKRKVDGTEPWFNENISVETVRQFIQANTVDENRDDSFSNAGMSYKLIYHYCEDHECNSCAVTRV